MKQRLRVGVGLYERGCYCRLFEWWLRRPLSCRCLLLLCSLSCSLCCCKHDHYRRRRCSFCSSPHVDSVRVATATQIVVACSVGRKPLFSLPSKRTQTLCLLDLLLLFIVKLHHCHHQLQIHCYQNTKSVLQIPLNKNYFVHVFSCFFFDN